MTSAPGQLGLASFWAVDFLFRTHRSEFISYHRICSIFKYSVMPSVIHTWARRRQLYKAPGCGRLERSPAPTAACEIPGQIPRLASHPRREGRLQNIHLLPCSKRKTLWSPAQSVCIMASAWTVGLGSEILCKPSCAYNPFSCEVSIVFNPNTLSLKCPQSLSLLFMKNRRKT